jgi:hypothetical protein
VDGNDLQPEPPISGHGQESAIRDDRGGQDASTTLGA